MFDTRQADIMYNVLGRRRIYMPGKPMTARHCHGDMNACQAKSDPACKTKQSTKDI